MDEDKPDKLISKIKKVDANAVSFKVSHDYKYLILRCSRMLSVASIKSLERDIKFDLIFKFSQDITYVSTHPQSIQNSNPSSMAKSLLLLSINQEYIGNDAEFFFFRTNFDAPKHRVIEVDIRNKNNMWNADVIIPVSNVFKTMNAFELNENFFGISGK